MLEIREIEKIYHSGPDEIRALDRISFDIRRGEFIRICGASGSGKSTLLNMLAGLDTPSYGSIETPIGKLDSLTSKEIANWRATYIGMVFQGFNLIAHRTALQNVELGLVFLDVPKPERLSRSKTILEKLGMGNRLNHPPSDLSGGEQQRVALARALVKKPRILFADEPTGNLDQENSDDIAALLTGLNKDGLTVVLVTHDLELGRESAHRTLFLRYGKIENIIEHKELESLESSEAGSSTIVGGSAE